MPEGNEKKAPTAGVPGWHEDPRKEAAERLWDGSKWTNETRGELPKEPTPSLAASGGGPAPTEYKGGGKVREWIRSRPVLWVSLAALLALIIGVAAGGDTTEKDDQIAEQKDQIASLESQLQSSEDAQDELAGQAADVKAEKAAVAAREQKVSQAEEIEKQSTFSDGVWKVGTDFDAGTYRSTSGDCYWEKLSSPGGGFNAIIANGSGPNQTVEIDSPWFSASDCGDCRQ